MQSWKNRGRTAADRNKKLSRISKRMEKKPSEGADVHAHDRKHACANFGERG